MNFCLAIVTKNVNFAKCFLLCNTPGWKAYCIENVKVSRGINSNKAHYRIYGSAGMNTDTGTVFPIYENNFVQFLR